jgi:F420-non-reducing hydrogenase iron-sulfur subunit
MADSPGTNGCRILVLATLSGGYRGADAAGQSHLDYAPNVYILPARTSAIFPPQFYLNSFEQGFDAIIVMYSGTDSPYKGESERTADIINRTYTAMKAKQIDTRRLRLAAICTVCVRQFLGEIQKMNELLDQIGPIQRRRPAGMTIRT